MRTLIAVVVPGVMVCVLAAIAVGIVTSASGGRPSAMLIGVFVVDSVALVVIAVRLSVAPVGRPR